MTWYHPTSAEVTTYTGSCDFTYFQNDLFTSNMHKFFGPQDTDELNQPIIVDGSAVMLDDGSDHTNDIGALQGQHIQLYLPVKASKRINKRQVVTRPSLRALENFGTSHGRSIARKKNLILLQAMYRVATVNTATADIVVDFGSTGSFATIDDAKVKTALRDIAQAMDNDEVDADGRYVLLPPTAFYQLAGIDAVMSKDFGKGGADRAMVGGAFASIDYLGLTVINCPFGFNTNHSTGYQTVTETFEADGTDTATPILPTLNQDMTLCYGLAWHRDSWAIRENESLNSSIDWIPEKQSWQTLSRMQFGFRCLKPQAAGIYRLVDAL